MITAVTANTQGAFTVGSVCMHKFMWSYNDPVTFREGEGRNDTGRTVSGTEEVPRERLLPAPLREAES